MLVLFMHDIRIEQDLSREQYSILQEEESSMFYRSGLPFRAICYCGWVGEWHIDANGAAWEAFDHERQFI